MAIDRPTNQHERIGRMREAFRFETPPTVPDSMGEIRPGTWTESFKTRGAITPQRGVTFMEGQSLNTEVTHKITIRHRSGVAPSMRIIKVNDSRVFDIRSIENPGNKNRWLHCMCQEQPIGAT